MFLFLSKLIPLFLYPVGLNCVLLVVALVLLWRRPRLAAIPIALALVVILVTSNAWFSGWLVRSLETQHVPQRELPPADAIVVLGGCTKSALPPRPGVDISEEGDRILYGAKLFLEKKAPKVILSGGRVDWRGTGPSESDDMAQIIMALGVPKTAILQDPTSLNTRENAVNVKQIMEANKIQSILLVTSAMHMPRSLRIFQKLGINAIPAPTDFLISDQDFETFDNNIPAQVLGALPEVDRLRGTTRALKEYIGIAIYWLRGWV